MLNENKPIQVVSIIAILSAIGVVCGILADSTTVIDWFTGKGKKKENIETSSVTIIETQVQPVPEVAETFQIVESETIPAPTEPLVVYLNSLKVTESSCFHSEDSIEDTIGNTYVGNVLLLGTTYGDDGYALYYLGGQYKSLSGTIAVSDESTQREGYEGQVVIFADDNEIYSTEKLGRKSVPIDFTINIENCQWLKINKIGKCHLSGTWYSGTELILHNWKLEK